jgi:hypothetical protein
MSVCPINRNSCFDPEEEVPQVAFCQPSSLDLLLAIPLGGLGVLATEIGLLSNGNYTAIEKFCNYNGGLGATSSGFAIPEWVGRTYGSFGDCHYDDEDVPCSFPSAGCSGFHCAIPGVNGLCTKTANFGDPLVCCLRDYQCNDGTDVFGRTCFSSDNEFATCPAEFRATDTTQCGFLIEQYCLGNYSSIDGSTYLPPGLDFTALWTDTQIEGEQIVVKALAPGTKYQISGDQPCRIGDLNPITGKPKNGKTCQTSGVIPAIHDTSSYTSGSIPICQQVFWRTLYGNQPTFKNQYWNTKGGPTDCTVESGADTGDRICNNTSVPPQVAACQANAFEGDPTPTGTLWAQNMLTSVYNKLTAKGVSLTSTIATGADQEFVQWLYTVCKKYPILCENFLQKECGGADPEEFKFNQNLWNWCGCYMSDDQYQRYTDNFGVTKECTPFCNAPNTIPLINGDTTQPLFCLQSVCIIDDVAITLVKTHFQNTNNNINFSQICSGCGSGYASGTNNQSNATNTTTNTNLNNVSTSNCQCILSNFTLNSLNATITGDGINLSQSCNGNSKCYNTSTNRDGTQTSTEVDCANNGIGINQLFVAQKAKQEKQANTLPIYWGILLAVIVVCLIIILWIIFGGKKVPENDVMFSRNEKVPIPPKPSQPPKPVVPPKPTVSIKPIIPITPIVQQVRYEPQITVYNPPDQNITVNKPTDLSEVNKSLKEDKETIRSLKDIIAKLNDEMLDLTTIPAQKLPRF